MFAVIRLHVNIIEMSVPLSTDLWVMPRFKLLLQICSVKFYHEVPIQEVRAYLGKGVTYAEHKLHMNGPGPKELQDGWSKFTN